MFRAKALIRCLPTENFATTSPTTSTNSTLPPGSVPTSGRRDSGTDPANRTTPRRRTNPPPTVKHVQAVGRWQCPRAVRLRGRIDVRRKFEGKAIFTGTQWLSPSTDLDFAEEGGRYIVASYPLDWPVGGLAGGSGNAPRKRLSFTFNVSDENGVLKRSKRKNITVTCKRG
jgi:hypothetical protein